jgi:hypothetical protein
MKTVRHDLKGQLREGLQGHFGRLGEGSGCRETLRNEKLEALEITNELKTETKKGQLRPHLP